MKETYTQTELDEIVGSVSDRVGWNFSVMKTLREPIPWEYGDIVRKYVKQTDSVLDIGTGGGERFIELAGSFGKGLGVDIDPEMVTVATKNAEGVQNVAFAVDDASLASISDSFDVIINRHCLLDLTAVTKHLKKDGYFITQQVGEKNMENIKLAIGGTIDMPVITRDQVVASGLNCIAFCEYNVEYVVQDIESLVFWLKALDMLHSDINGSKAVADAETLNSILHGNVDERGFITNEQRFLVVAKK
jgi:SAM-dependent methyltransferase